MSMVPAVFITLFLAFAIFGVVSAIRHRNQEMENFSHIATAKGWTYPVAPEVVTAKFRFLPQVRVRRLHDVIEGEYKGIPFYAFNYEIKRETRTNDSRTDRYYTCHAVLIQTPTALPQINFEGDQYTGLHIPKGFEQPDVYIGYPPFDNKWQILTHDPGFAKSLLQQPLTEHMAHTDVPTWQIIQGHVLARFHGAQKSESILDDIQDVFQLLELIDERVWSYYDPQGQIPAALNKK